MQADSTDPRPLPQHVAIVMDGNGRWAERRRRPRTAGHQAGQKALRRIVEHAGRRGIGTLTVFAFSSENWNRPPTEVSRLMDLFLRALDKEVREIHENGVRVSFIGGRTAFAPELQERMQAAEDLTRDNTQMRFNVAVNYGGRWDITEAARSLAAAVSAGQLAAEDIDEATFGSRLSLADGPDPDLFIRTGGEQRLSNFLLWQSAYAELWFTDVLWPDFGAEELDRALSAFAGRERRFGNVNERNNAHA